MKRILLAALVLLTFASPARASDFTGTNYAALGNCSSLTGGTGISALVLWQEAQPRKISGTSTIGCANRTGINLWNLQGVYRYRVTGTQTWTESTCKLAASEPYEHAASWDPSSPGPWVQLPVVLLLGPNASGTQTWDWQLRTNAYFYTYPAGNYNTNFVASPTIISNYLPPTSGCGA